MWQLQGQDRLLARLDKTFKLGRFAHAYLLVGPPHVGKRTLAINMAQAANCLDGDRAPCGGCSQCSRIVTGRHADVVFVGEKVGAEDSGSTSGPGRREIGIESVRELERQASLTPNEGNYRVFIFDGAEGMSDEAANALLKTLEEPPPQVLLLLLTRYEEALLSTIRSRCHRLELKPAPLSKVEEVLVNTHSVPEQDAAVLARLSMGCLGWALDALEDPSIMAQRQEALERIDHLAGATLEERFSYAADLASTFVRDREEALRMMDLWLRWWRDLLMIKEGAEEFIYNIEWVRTLQARSMEYSTPQVVTFIGDIMDTLEALHDNANVRLALEVLMLSLPGKHVAA